MRPLDAAARLMGHGTRGVFIGMQGLSEAAAKFNATHRVFNEAFIYESMLAIVLWRSPSGPRRPTHPLGT